MSVSSVNTFPDGSSFKVTRSVLYLISSSCTAHVDWYCSQLAKEIELSGAHESIVSSFVSILTTKAVRNKCTTIESSMIVNGLRVTMTPHWPRVWDIVFSTNEACRCQHSKKELILNDARSATRQNKVKVLVLKLLFELSVRIHLTTGESGTKHRQAIRTGFYKEFVFTECLDETSADCLTMFCPGFSCC